MVHGPGGGPGVIYYLLPITGITITSGIYTVVKVDPGVNRGRSPGYYNNLATTILDIAIRKLIAYVPG